jgi:hypothetical protein
MKFTIELQGNAPKWTNEATHYFENRYAEQWIAKVNIDKIVITGLDIGWKEIAVNFNEAKEYLEIQKEGMFAISEKECEIILNKVEEARKNNNSMFKYGFNEEEKYWLISLLSPFVKENELKRKFIS